MKSARKEQNKYAQRILEVSYEGQNSETVPLYTMPMKNDWCGKIFKPQEWSLENFEIGRPLGAGKFGHVYLARQKKTKYIVALKVISKKQIRNSQIINQIRRQIEIHSHAKHQNILRMFGFFYDQNKIYYILQYATGGQLYKSLKEHKSFDEVTASQYIRQIANAIKYMHELNIMHRDIKPENILICNKNNQKILKMTDFGWSVHAPSNKRYTLCGTPDYLSPEIVDRKPHDKAVDIWGLGVLAYELVAGKAPFQSNTKADVFKRIRRLDIEFPNIFSEQLKDFITRILVKEPENRLKIDKIINHPWIIMNRKSQ